MQRLKVGRESDFFAHPLVTGIEITDNLKVGDRIRISGHAAGLEMVVESMQVDNNERLRGLVGSGAATRF